MIQNHFTADGKTTLCGCTLAPRNFSRFTTNKTYLVTCQNCKPLARPYRAFAVPAK